MLKINLQFFAEDEPTAEEVAKTFSADYVKALRDESKDHRLARKAAEEKAAADRMAAKKQAKIDQTEQRTSAVDEARVRLEEAKNKEEGNIRQQQGLKDEAGFIGSMTDFFGGSSTYDSEAELSRRQIGVIDKQLENIDTAEQTMNAVADNKYDGNFINSQGTGIVKDGDKFVDQEGRTFATEEAALKRNGYLYDINGVTRISKKGQEFYTQRSQEQLDAARGIAGLSATDALTGEQTGEESLAGGIRGQRGGIRQGAQVRTKEVTDASGYKSLQVESVGAAKGRNMPTYDEAGNITGFVQTSKTQGEQLLERENELIAANRDLAFATVEAAGIVATAGAGALATTGAAAARSAASTAVRTGAAAARSASSTAVRTGALAAVETAGIEGSRNYDRVQAGEISAEEAVINTALSTGVAASTAGVGSRYLGPSLEKAGSFIKGGVKKGSDFLKGGVKKGSDFLSDQAAKKAARKQAMRAAGLDEHGYRIETGTIKPGELKQVTYDTFLNPKNPNSTLSTTGIPAGVRLANTPIPGTPTLKEIGTGIKSRATSATKAVTDRIPKISLPGASGRANKAASKRMIEGMSSSGKAAKEAVTTTPKPVVTAPTAVAPKPKSATPKPPPKPTPAPRVKPKTQTLKPGVVQKQVTDARQVMSSSLADELGLDPKASERLFNLTEPKSVRVGPEADAAIARGSKKQGTRVMGGGVNRNNELVLHSKSLQGEKINKGLLEHEFGHVMENNLRASGNKAGADVLGGKDPAMQESIERFLADPKGYNAIKDSKMYSADFIRNKPNEMFTELLKSRNTDAYKDNPAAQKLLREYFDRAGISQSGVKAIGPPKTTSPVVKALQQPETIPTTTATPKTPSKPRGEVIKGRNQTFENLDLPATQPKPVPKPEVTPRMLKGLEDLKIERQGPGASFYEGEEWERLVKGGIPNEFRTYGTSGSATFPSQQAEAYSRLRAAQRESRGIARSNVGPEWYSGFEGSFFDKKGNLLGDLEAEQMLDTVTKLRGGVEDTSTSYIVDPNGGIKIIGVDTTGRAGGELYNIPPDVITPELMENIRKLGLPQIEYKRGGGPIYASKGMFVPKGPDTIPAMLAPNEFVVNGQSAINNLDLLKQINASRGPLYMNQGGIVSGSSPAQAENYYGTLGGNNQTNQMGNNFAGYVEQLQNFQFPTIPERIEMVGSHTVDVNVNGAGAFESLQGGIMNMINSEIGKTMDGLWNQSNGAVGRASR
jgi:hypothetical protein